MSKSVAEIKQIIAKYVEERELKEAEMYARKMERARGGRPRGYRERTTHYTREGRIIPREDIK